ncbi:hypothetical protein [Rhodobacteraceae bacterium DSL-40]|uniref:hypothetical protein n=1 Tax=Amaricoccus sp. B4 TaxID=3368557 RepID=UPI0013A6B785
MMALKRLQVSPRLLEQVFGSGKKGFDAEHPEVFLACDQENQPVFVGMSSSRYRLLVAAVDLARDPEKMKKSLSDSADFSNGKNVGTVEKFRDFVKRRLGIPAT